MFCAKCGKQIENDSTFCPFCGQQVDAPVTDTRLSFKAKPIINQSIKKFSVLQGILSNKMIWGIALALMAVIGVGFGATKLIGGKKSVPEKLLDMSWKDIVDISAMEYSDVLDDKGMLYVLEKAKASYAETSDIADHVAVTIPDSFLGWDCYFEYIDIGHMSMYDVLYENYKDFKNSRKSIEDYLNRNLIKNSTIITADFGTGNPTLYFYPVEVSNKKIDVYADEVIKYGNEIYDYYLSDWFGFPFTPFVMQNISLEEGEEALRERLSECSIYKFVDVTFDHDDGFVDWDIMIERVGEEYLMNAYVPNMCALGVFYVPLTEGQFATIQALQGWDSISGKEIDIDNFKDTVDKKIVECFKERIDKQLKKMPYYKDDEKEEAVAQAENFYYNMLYMMEKHKLDVNTYSFLDDESEYWWYIENFKYDIHTNEIADIDRLVEDTVSYRSEQVESGLKMVDTMTLGVKGDVIVKIIEKIEIDMSSFGDTEQEKLVVAYDAMVEQYAAVEGVECTGSAGTGTYTITIAIDATGDAVETLASQELLTIEGNGSKLSIEATGKTLEDNGYKLVE